MTEIVERNKTSNIQLAVSELAEKSQQNKFQLNKLKCKELRIAFAKSTPDFVPLVINEKPTEIVPHIKLLDLKWNRHVSEIVRKVSTRLYFLRQLKRANVPTKEVKELLTFYVTCIRPITEYACPVFHNGLPQYLADDLERLQKRALRIIYSSLTRFIQKP